ncbi:DUF4177 domain-containing protein [Halomicroarcula sp. GCM10025324]|uniref:DUF4177 domain-containing protein n=1 Tax=Haloarcula TaxID=2237 RepID=UPI0023E7F2CA|nr:DUF4177 domain-containing protein [Halomicroarcula sp. ZS-22-S1]
MPSFEYRALEVDTGMLGSSSVPENRLNELGADGWEVVAPITEKRGQTSALVGKREAESPSSLPIGSRSTS